MRNCFLWLERDRSIDRSKAFRRIFHAVSIVSERIKIKAENFSLFFREMQINIRIIVFRVESEGCLKLFLGENLDRFISRWRGKNLNKIKIKINPLNNISRCSKINLLRKDLSMKPTKLSLLSLSSPFDQFGSTKRTFPNPWTIPIIHHFASSSSKLYIPI